MKNLNLFLLFAILFVFACCDESKQNKPESKTITREQPENQTKTDSVFTFDADEVGKMPVGWTNYYTGKGNLGKWEIRDDGGKKVLAQVSQENFGYHFDVIVLDSSDYQNLEITVKFKGVKGEEDQGGGPVWRYQDSDNYYFVRANPLENNFRLYKVIDGNRIQLASADIDIPTGEWHTIKIRMLSNHIECFYDGKKYLDVTDETFKDSGKVGLWTKADAFTFFKDLKIFEK
ncbi:MAG TPA: DUF1080 domain-containing protein [bacterium]|nr:DUF1080 domain-containing protein [bacterium]